MKNENVLSTYYKYFYILHLLFYIEKIKIIK